MSYPSPMRSIITDFRAGEIDPRVYMRIDSKVYTSGARRLKNVILSNTGAASRRPGSTRLTQLAGRGRLVEFEFDFDEKYIFCFRNNALEIYDENGGLVQSFSGSSNCPWTSSSIWQLTYAQLADVIVICHESHRPIQYTRTGLTTFVPTSFTFAQSVDTQDTYQPYTRYEPSSVRLSVSAVTVGAGRTITSNTAIFSAAWVNDTIRIFGAEILITAFVSTTQLTGTVRRAVQAELESNPLRTREGSSEIEVFHPNHGLLVGTAITVSGAQAQSGITAANINGARTIATVLDDNRYTFTAGAGSATSSTDGGGSGVVIQTTAQTANWDEQTFSARRGWPSAVAFHEDRLWFGGTTQFPNAMWGSVVGAYRDFDKGTGQDDESVQFSIASQRFSKIRHLVSARGLLVFSESTEFAVETNVGEPITPGGAEVRAQTSYGANYVRPRLFDGAVLFVQPNGKTIREFIYDFSSDSFNAADITTVASHLIKNPVDFTVVYGTQTRGEQYAIFVNTDGTLAIFHSIRQEQLAAWTPWETRAGDAYDSVCTLGQKVFVSVERDGNYYLERLELDAPIWLDSAVSLSGPSATVWTLGASYAGQTVSVISGGRHLGEFVANGSGQITLPSAVTSLVAGFQYEVIIEPMPPERDFFDGTATGQRRRINAVNIHWYQTVAATVNGVKILGQNELTEEMGQPPVPFTGKKRTFLRGYNMDPVFTITQEEPLQMTVLGAVMEVSL